MDIVWKNKGFLMQNKDKAIFFERIAEMQEIKMIEESLKENPLFEDELFPDWNILFNGSKAISSFGE